MADLLNKQLETVVKRLLKAAKSEPFESQLNALKVAIVWYSSSRKINNPGDQTGSLLDEMRKAIEDGERQAADANQ